MIAIEKHEHLSIQKEKKIMLVHIQIAALAKKSYAMNASLGGPGRWESVEIAITSPEERLTNGTSYSNKHLALTTPVVPDKY
ncbi:MAG: hypothetical protein ACJA0H_001183 [Francisellaceae bacterium]|jgi:hypothetical protein